MSVVTEPRDKASGHSDSLNSGGSSGSSSPFQTAIVVDFISNPSQYFEENIDIPSSGYTSKPGTRIDLIKDESNPEFSISNLDAIKTAPRNSIIAITSGESGEGQRSIFFPFFPPHMGFPVKSGEKVWVFFDGGGGNNTKPTGYWLFRKSGNLQIDDLNYTHFDRQHVSEKASSSMAAWSSPVASNDSENDYHSFPNGNPSNQKERSLKDEFGYGKIVKISQSYKTMKGEPVVRYSKRSSDLTLQGSNNTLISLGMDRLNDIFLQEDTEGRGTIDIVTGRGQSSQTSAVSTFENKRKDSSPYKDVKWDEIEKAPEEMLPGQKDNILEGDNDFANDLSRIYVSMKTSGDDNFELTYPTIGNSIPVLPVADKPYIVIKSNENRIISRQEGSIKIVKEDITGITKSVIIMQPDGTIMIDGPKIIIGSGLELANGMGNQVFLGRDATESIVLGDKLREKLDAFMDAFIDHVHPTGAGASGPATTSAAVAGTKGSLMEILSKNGKTK